MNKNLPKWFKSYDCDLLILQQYVSLADNTVTHTARVDDKTVIEDLMKRIAQIPDGDMLKSFSEDADYMTAEFVCGENTQKLSVIRGMFQTPNTAFNSVGSYPLQAGIVADMQKFLTAK